MARCDIVNPRRVVSKHRFIDSAVVFIMWPEYKCLTALTAYIGMDK